jgi:hypothetical protein
MSKKDRKGVEVGVASGILRVLLLIGGAGVVGFLLVIALGWLIF